MDCDSCGRYRPSSEIVPIHEPGGRRIVMACARCRRLMAGSSSAPNPIAEATHAIPIRHRAFYAN